MKIEVINTGTELLLGNTPNTHGAWLGRELFKLGLRVARQITVPDGDAIREALEESIARADAVVVTGGLGPTSDDLTREITASVLGLELIMDEAALRSLHAFFTSRGRTMVDANLKQALCPVGADILPNANGTAPGIYIPPRINGRSNCAVFLLPGPPRELYPIYQEEVVPRLRALAGVEAIPTALVLKFTGIGESDFHHGVDQSLGQIPGLEYGYCAHMGEVDLRLIGAASAVDAGRQLAIRAFAPYLVSDDESSLEKVLIHLLSARSLKISTAESCTGGQISHRLTNVPGSSAVFTHGFVTYANEAKTQMLGVSAEVIADQGAVSEAVAIAMAEGAMRVSGADIAVSVTGIAGPGGGSEEKPVGTAWIGLATKDRPTVAVKTFHPRNRQDFKLATSQSALEIVRRYLLEC